jgi:NTE family protein
MNIKDFTENAEVVADIARIRAKKPQVSDTFDAQGNQYVDIVMEGGGVLGIALVGYTYALEQAKIKFCSLAGTSAGAINAMMLASVKPTKHSTISEELIEIISNKNFFDFVDGEPYVKKIIKDVLSDQPMIWVGIKNLFNLGKLLRLIREELGLNEGKNFEDWVQNILETNQIHNTSDLQNHRNAIARQLKLRDGVTGNTIFNSKIAIIASDVTTQTKVEFPLHKELYFKDSDLVSPSKYVRATMSIPLFFKPFTIQNLPKNREKLWKDTVGYEGEIPNKINFVDGGTLSNFPINVFHLSAGVPRKPTFGVRLGKDRQKFNSIKTFLKYFFAIFNTMRYLHDYDFLLKNQDYRHLIGMIDTDGHNWLNFDITDEEKLDLFKKGVRAAADFLVKFDWEGYKKLRATLG